MLAFLIHALSNTFSFALTVVFCISLIVSLVYFVADKYFKGVLALVPMAAVIGTLAYILTFVTGMIKVMLFVTFMMNAQNKINDLNKQLASSAQTIRDKDEEIRRKDTQRDTVNSGDARINNVYIPQYRTIETLRTVPDLTLANKLSQDLITNFYESELDVQPPKK